MFSREYLQKSIREGFKGVGFGKTVWNPGDGTIFRAFPREFEDKEFKEYQEKIEVERRKNL